MSIHPCFHDWGTILFVTFHSTQKRKEKENMKSKETHFLIDVEFELTPVFRI